MSTVEQHCQNATAGNLNVRFCQRFVARSIIDITKIEEV